jgi:hypothetical protein
MIHHCILLLPAGICRGTNKGRSGSSPHPPEKECFPRSGVGTSIDERRGRWGPLVGSSCVLHTLGKKDASGEVPYIPFCVSIYKNVVAENFRKYKKQVLRSCRPFFLTHKTVLHILSLHRRKFRANQFEYSKSIIRFFVAINQDIPDCK